SQAPAHVVRILHDCERLARLSDRIVKVGPLNLGIDSALALIPIGGGLYTIGLGAWLLYMGWKAEASPATLARMAAYVGADALTAEVPVLGAAVDALFPGHILAVKALRRDLERRWGPIVEREPTRRRSFAGVADRLRGRNPAGA
ncbi:MAG: DUF4112 domain-containing protein, partial [Caulobacteraceae bacterium]|nr:DUF4112 domain-containing protein [Caulobacter sp.]